MEARTLKELSKAVGVEDPVAAELIVNAEKQNEARQTEQAYVMADKAVLQYQLSMLKRENDVLTEDKNSAEKELTIYRDALNKQKAPKQVN
jgi:4-hydroxy-L-threonine phosphate dehydrogenase PdxA